MPKRKTPTESDKVINLQEFIDQRQPQNQPVHSDLCQMLSGMNQLRQKGDIVGAINLGIQAYKNYPDSYELCLELGTMLGEQTHFDKALHYLKRAAKLDPKRSEGHLFLGFVYYELGHYRHAIKALQRCLEHNPNCYQASATIADCWRILGKPKEAIDILLELHEQGGQNDESLNLLGVLYLEANDTLKAIATLRRALSYNPQSPAVCTNLGVAYLHRGFIDMGIKYFNQATRLVSDDDDVHYNLAHALILRGDYQEAKEPAFKSLQYANTLRNRLLLCNILVALEEWNEVDNYLDDESEAISAEERSALCMVHGKRAIHYKDFSLACFYFDRASQYNQFNPDSPFQAAFAHIACGDLNKAYKRVKRAIAINDQIAGYFLLKGDIEYNLGKTMQAEQSWREALRLEAASEPDVMARLQGNVPVLTT